MKQLTAEQINAKRQKQIEAAQRQRERQQERQRERLASPEFREQQRVKAAAMSARRIARLTSPEYRAEQMEKARKKQEVKAAAPPAVKRKTALLSTRGTKGRAPSADEKRVMDALGRLPCIACMLNGQHTDDISLHHIYGRTKPGAHFAVIPLCKWHHQLAAPLHVRLIHPWLVPVHADGIVGGRKLFEDLNGTQEELLAESYRRAAVPMKYYPTNLVLS